MGGNDSGPTEVDNGGSNGTSWMTEDMSRERAKKVMRKMQFLTVMAAIGGFLFGYDTGVISGAMLPIKQAFNLSPPQEEAVVSSTVFSAFVASLVGGSMNRMLGRRVCILIAAAVFTVGSFILAASWNYPVLVVGRIVVGVGIGIASLTTPIYIAELAMPSIRGQLVTVNILLVTFGQFFAGMIDGIFVTIMPVNGWRFMLGLASVPSIIMFVGFLTLPESPRWLATKGRNEEAFDVLKTVRNSDREAEDERNDIVGSVTPEETGSTDDDDGQSFLSQVSEMLSNRPTRRALVLGCGIMLLQQLSGINTVMVSAVCLVVLQASSAFLFSSTHFFQYYAASIYQMSQFSGKQQLFSGVVDSTTSNLMRSSRENRNLAEWIYSFGTGVWNRIQYLFGRTSRAPAACSIFTFPCLSQSCWFGRVVLLGAVDVLPRCFLGSIVWDARSPCVEWSDEVLLRLCQHQQLWLLRWGLCSGQPNCSL